MAGMLLAVAPVVCSAAALLLQPLTAHGQEFRALGVPSIATNTTAKAMSDNGEIVIGTIRDNAFLWDDAIWTAAGGWQRAYSYLGGVSADGATMVGFSWDAPRRAVLHSTASGVGLILGQTGETPTAALGISGNGRIIVGYTAPTLSEARATIWSRDLAWPTGDMDAIELTSDHSMANDASYDGGVVVGNLHANGGRAFRWTAATGLQTLPVPGDADSTAALAVSGDGRVVVGRALYAGYEYACRWVDGGAAELLGMPRGSIACSAGSVNHVGDVIAGWSSTGSVSVAFVWTESLGMINLRELLVEQGMPDDWRPESVSALSPDGRLLLGVGNHAGRTEAWMARVKLPCSAADIATEGNPLGGPDEFVSGVDFDVFVFAFFQGLRRNGTGSLIADIGGANGEPERDGFITGADFDVFLQHFFAGC